MDTNFEIKYYTCGFCFSNDRKSVLLVQKNNPEWQKGKLNGVGGKMEPNEDAYSCMIREFEEEVGVKTDFSDWQSFLTIDVINKARVYFFKSFLLDQFQIPIENDVGELLYCCSVEKIFKSNTLYNLKWIIPLALDKDVVTADVYDNGVNG